MKTGTNEPVLWSCQHPENWSTAAVQEWMAFVCNKYSFPEPIHARVLGVLHGYTGKKLLAMLLPDFRIQFGDVGELIFTALQQILDVAPQFEERSRMYAWKIKRLLKELTDLSSNPNPSPMWKSLQLEHWSSTEVHDWIKSAANEYNMESRDRKWLQDIFCRHTGADLISMTLEDFTRISSDHGEILFMTLHSHRQEEGVGRKRHRSSGELASIPENKET